jgi:hypothetical protein
MNFNNIKLIFIVNTKANFILANDKLSQDQIYRLRTIS